MKEISPEEAREHIANIKRQIFDITTHIASLEREYELVEPLVLSKIGTPKTIITNLANIKKEELQTDIISAKNATMEQIQQRKAWYYNKLELAELRVMLAAKEQDLQRYTEHIQVYFSQQNTSIKDDTIFDMVRTAQSLKNLSESQTELLKTLVANMLTKINSGPEGKLELFNALKKIIDEANFKA